MEKKKNSYIFLIIIVIVVVYVFADLAVQRNQLKKNNSFEEKLYQLKINETVRESLRERENNQQFSPNHQTQTKEKNSSNNDYLRGMDLDKLSEQNKETSRRTQEKLNEINKNSKLNQNKESPKNTLTCIKNKVGGIESVNCY